MSTGANRTNLSMFLSVLMRNTVLECAGLTALSRLTKAASSRRTPKHAYSMPDGLKLVPFSPDSIDTNHRAGGFSLLEIMISILMITILIGLLLPVFPVVTRSAKRRQATTQTIALVNAIKSYRTTYGRWPGQSGRSTNDIFYSSSNAVADMIAELTNNPRNIVFLDIPDSSLENNCMSDPWGQPYVVAFDADANGMLSCIISNGTTSATLYRSNETAVAISWGHKATDTESWIYSWPE